MLSVGANLLGEGKAVLLRDGQRYEGIRRRGEGEKLMQFFDANRQRLPFKPGTAWFNLTAANYPGAEIVFQP